MVTGGQKRRMEQEKEDDVQNYKEKERFLGKEVVRITQSKNKNRTKMLTRKKRYQICSQLGMSTSRTEGRRW